MTLRREGPRPAVVGTCTLPLRESRDADQLLAAGLAMIDQMAQGFQNPPGIIGNNCWTDFARANKKRWMPAGDQFLGIV